jgi:hypothetical protein
LKRPAFQFYPGDWQRDAALRSCSVAARGLWMEMLCVMHQGEPYGHLVINGKAVTPEQLARMVGATVKEITKWWVELEDAGVFSSTEGKPFSRRMVRDERIRNIRADSGRLGGNPNLVNQKDNQPDNHRIKQSDNQSPTPSSSSSSSSSKRKNKGNGSAAHAAFLLPDWIPKPAWDAWVAARKKSKKPPTDFALDLAVGKLEILRAAGHDPAAVLERSAFNGWADLFPLPEEKQVKQRGEVAWWTSEAEIAAKGSEFGLSPNPGEDWGRFKDRIFAAIRGERHDAN